MLGRKIKELRFRNGWSQQRLAHEAGLSFNAITKIEQGIAKRPIIQTVIKIADAFSISLDDLMERDASYHCAAEPGQRQQSQKRYDNK